MEKLQEVFNAYDVDGSGSIERSELPLLLSKLLPADGAYTQEELDEVWNNIDQNSSGDIDFKEFCAFLLGVLSPMKTYYFDSYIKEVLRQADKMDSLSAAQKNTIAKVFAKFDSNNSGDIDQEELVALIGKMTGEQPTIEEIAQTLQQLDVSGDGNIDLYEFTRYIALTCGDLSEDQFESVMAQFLD
eukprot:TRINITY_DN7064_c0_g1_i3.p2 TRINITY_DN7064_c0_g1~~TRINITY_DN7064_c0_g1_i3.p2  ORF type:complete len:187 (-),score=80.49 TRINITY_DN7064_c0_g1_i3:691-1251(-)